jgi:hypothetical protein
MKKTTSLYGDGFMCVETKRINLLEIDTQRQVLSIYI